MFFWGGSRILQFLMPSGRYSFHLVYFFRVPFFVHSLLTHQSPLHLNGTFFLRLCQWIWVINLPSDYLSRLKSICQLANKYWYTVHCLPFTNRPVTSCSLNTSYPHIHTQHTANGMKTAYEIIIEDWNKLIDWQLLADGIFWFKIVRFKNESVAYCYINDMSRRLLSERW